MVRGAKAVSLSPRRLLMVGTGTRTSRSGVMKGVAISTGSQWGASSRSNRTSRRTWSVLGSMAEG